MAGSSSAPSDHRRKWDKDYYEQLAADRIREELDLERSLKSPSEEPVKRELLKARDYEVDLTANLNKSQVITKSGPGGGQAGYYCNVCDCVVKDSINFLDHINGRKHQRNLGMSMKVKRSSLDDVKQRFQTLKTKSEEKKKGYSLEERIREIAEEEEKLRAYRKDKKKEKKRKHEADEEDLETEEDNEMAAMMGFAAFMSKKKKS